MKTKPPKAKSTLHIFTVRERPVGFRSSRFGGELVAVERGYFPVSGTGYRSLSGAFGFDDKVGASAIPEDYLERLAKSQDETRHAALRRVSRAPKPEGRELSNFISASIDAENALNEGFFAPEPERRALWSGAYGVLCLVDTDARFQPKPDDGVWTPERCANALATQRELLRWAGDLARGEFAPPRLGWLYCAHAYLGLPPKPAGEPGFPPATHHGGICAAPSRHRARSTAPACRPVPALRGVGGVRHQHRTDEPLLICATSRPET